MFSQYKFFVKTYIDKITDFIMLNICIYFNKFSIGNVGNKYVATDQYLRGAGKKTPLRQRQIANKGLSIEL